MKFLVAAGVAGPNALDAWQRPFESYRDQPGTAERVRLEVQSIPFGIPEKELVAVSRNAAAGAGRPLIAGLSPRAERH